MASSNGLALEGRVEAVNATGVRVDGEWRNVSRFHPVELPERGSLVRLEIDAKGYIRTLQVVETAVRQSTGRDRTITRLAVLKAAANFLGQMAQVHPEVKSDHVLTLADKWVAWVEAPPPEEPES